MFIYLNDINVYNLFSKKQIFMENINFKKLTNLIRVGDMSPVTLAEYYLNRIHKYNTDLNAFITVLEKDAISEAKIAEKEISNGNYRGPLHGIPYGVKDIIIQQVFEQQTDQRNMIISFQILMRFVLKK